MPRRLRLYYGGGSRGILTAGRVRAPTPDRPPMRDDRNYYELTRGPVDGPAPGDAVDAIDGALPCPRSLQSRRTRSTRKHSALVVERTGCHVIGGRAPLRPRSSMLG